MDSPQKAHSGSGSQQGPGLASVPPLPDIDPQFVAEKPAELKGRRERNLHRFLEKVEASRNFQYQLLKNRQVKESAHASQTTRRGPTEFEDRHENPASNPAPAERAKSISNLSESNAGVRSEDGRPATYSLAHRTSRFKMLKEAQKFSGKHSAFAPRPSNKTIDSPTILLQPAKLMHVVSQREAHQTRCQIAGATRRPSDASGSQRARPSSADQQPSKKPKKAQKVARAAQPKLPSPPRHKSQKRSEPEPSEQLSVDFGTIFSDDENKINFGNSLALGKKGCDEGYLKEDEQQVETIVFRRREETPESDDSQLSGPMMLLASGFTAVAVTGFIVVKGLRSVFG